MHSTYIKIKNMVFHVLPSMLREVFPEDGGTIFLRNV